jgi:hypothetical protein
MSEPIECVLVRVPVALPPTPFDPDPVPYPFAEECFVPRSELPSGVRPLGPTSFRLTPVIDPVERIVPAPLRPELQARVDRLQEHERI